MLPYTITLDELSLGLHEYETSLRYFYEHTIISPLDLVQRERMLRTCESQNIDLGLATPTDILVFGYGEPPDQHVTKIGGLPYWPESKPWPKSGDGQSLEFLAQINFAGSKDLCPAIPAELLLIFVESDGDEISRVHLEWQSCDPAMELITPEDLPSRLDPFVASPAYAVHCRTREYAAGEEAIAKSEYEEWDGIAITRASKIGGIPNYFHARVPRASGEYFATLHSMRHPTNIPWPFSNVEEPLTPEMLGGIGVGGGAGCYDTIMFNDQGSLFLFIDELRRVTHKIQCW